MIGPAPLPQHGSWPAAVPSARLRTGPAATLPMLRSCRGLTPALLGAFKLFCCCFCLWVFFPQTLGGILWCQLLPWHDNPSFPEIRDGARRSPPCIPLHCLYLENCCSRQTSRVGGTGRFPAGRPPGSLQGGSRNNQSLPFSGAFQLRISKHADLEAN